jgi:hypothetical protein
MEEILVLVHSMPKQVVEANSGPTRILDLRKQIYTQKIFSAILKLGNVSLKHYHSKDLTGQTVFLR